MIKNYKDARFMTHDMQGYDDCPFHNTPHTQLPNGLIEGILSHNLTKNETRSILLISRLTFGCHKSEAKLKKVDFKLTGIPGSEIRSVLDKLAKKNIMTIRQATDRCAAVSINLETENWNDKTHSYWDKKKFSRLIGDHLSEGNWG